MRSPRICVYESHLYGLKRQFIVFCIIIGQAQSKPVSSLQATGMFQSWNEKGRSTEFPIFFSTFFIWSLRSTFLDLQELKHTNSCFQA